MKLAYFSSLLPLALAAPASVVDPREPKEDITDRYLFSTPLPTFLEYREKENPDSLDWTSDGCTHASNNPFGFPFEPACQRHDFGYRNYQAQTRFESDSRYRIDLNFYNDMIFQCTDVSALRSCHGLADVYYAGVRMFGGFAKRDEMGAVVASATDPKESAEDLIAVYYTALQEYHQAVKADQADGLLPRL
ncbi:phospholipase A2 [Beauveria bassiana ARSEF 2860]|uniref:Secretory phospholipase A2 n=1 Tax=Beauveria bassiana (strain ARSEF 2860) TaxID=655819 RepID=PLA2_BEAB2|nr:phospholipase A2 [Beauveria bassiana ARSEF 2860]J4KMY5.1 RecName: Full=Secretory phospholipase A2; Flags: Precursor [Beauveria bassiana ARSEF 2860]EJP64764.1 phospholipase A2 [Beauveria bassiana ARSEF 2860]